LWSVEDSPLAKAPRKPIIGLAGGIGSGKSTVAAMMARSGGYVIDADALAREALQRPDVRRQLVQWWGQEILDEQGEVDRRRVADRVFDEAEARGRLERLIHPMVGAERQRLMEAAHADPGVRFIVQDVPLLFEVGLDGECDRTVFVDADEQTRLERVKRTRGWDRAELARREKNQWPLDRKRQAADAILENNGDPAQCMAQVRSLVDRFLSDHEMNVPAAE
jgi:dephospho-CoA kinase